MTTKVVFYDMPDQERYNWVVTLVEKACRAKKSMLIHCESVEQTQQLDELLWTYREDAFLPHEVVGADGALTDPEASVVLTTQEADPIQAEILLLNAPATLAFAEGYPTVLELVDHRTEASLQESRTRFKQWRDRGVDLSYKKK